MPVALNGTIYSIPTIVDGKIYVGTTYGPGGIGTLYKIDLFTGNIDDHFDTPVGSGYAPGIGGSPAVGPGKEDIKKNPGDAQCVAITPKTKAAKRGAHLLRTRPSHQQPTQR